jgi:glycerophosphoryl diester phosphodiesterase
MFECDAKLSSDGVVFLMHDATLERTTNGSGIGGDKTWSELSQLDAGGWHSREYAGEPLPTLEALARWCIANRHFFNIEIKPTPGTDLHTGREVARQAAGWWRGHTPPLLTSFRTESLQGALEVAPHLPRGLLLDTLPADWLATASSLRCQAIVCNHALWNEDTVAQAKAAGFKCLSYTVNDAWAAQRLLDLGTDAIITDRVDLFPPA